MLKPRQDFILVKPHVRKQSDIIEIVSHHEKHCRGTIVAVGPGKEDKRGRVIPLDAKVGDVVIFGDGNFDFYPTYQDGNESYRLIQEGDICGILDPEEADLKEAA